MSLFFATLAAGFFLLLLGGLYLFAKEAVREGSLAWPRSKMASYLLFGGAALWFLWHVAHLNQADFGDYSNLLLLLFGVVAIGSFFFVRDFLAVRGLAILTLLIARLLLDAAYMQFQYPQRLFLVSFVYVAIVAALYLGCAPYRMRDLYQWLYKKQMRLTICAGLTAAYGLLLRVFSRGRVTYRQIGGAVAIYLLLGLVFSDMYFLLEWLQPGAFDRGTRAGLGSAAADFSYFSFVTLTTVGYGDITPLNEGARQLSVLQGLIGQLFPAVLLARLVSMEIGGRED